MTRPHQTPNTFAKVESSMSDGAAPDSGVVGGAAPIPRLSVGLAVYNGEEYLRESVDSILSQTFSDFELIISDNASTDGTAEICAEYLADPRVRYLRNQVNIGGANNENRTITLARARYFRLTAHDDVCAPTLFERCVEVLDRDSDVVLVYTKTVSIDQDGRATDETLLGRGTAPTAVRRFWQLAFRNHGCEPTYGVVRTDLLRATGLQRNYTDSDRVMLCDLALRGPFVELDEPLFFKRYHRKNMYTDWRARMVWFNPSRKGAITFPNWLQCGHLFAVAAQVPDRKRDKAACLAICAYWILRCVPKLGKDVVEAVRSIVFRRPRTESWRFNWE